MPPPAFVAAGTRGWAWMATRTLAAVLAVVATSIFPVLLLVRSAHLLPQGQDPRIVVFAVQALILSAILLLFRIPPRRLSPAGLSHSGLMAGFWFVLASLLFSLLVLCTAIPFDPRGGNVERLLAEWTREFPSSGVPGRLAFVVILVPIFEEFLYRGLVLGYVLRGARTWLALSVTTALFAAGHGSLLLSGMLGLALGLLYLRYRNLWLCILVHGAHNLLSSAGATLLVAWLRDKEWLAPPEGSVLPLQVAGLAAVIGCLGMCAARLFSGEGSLSAGSNSSAPGAGSHEIELR